MNKGSDVIETLVCILYLYIIFLPQVEKLNKRVKVFYQFINPRLTAHQSINCMSSVSVCVSINPTLEVNRCLALRLLTIPHQGTFHKQGQGREREKKKKKIVQAHHCVRGGKVQNHTSHHYLPGFLL